MTERPVVPGTVVPRGTRWQAQLPPSMGRRSMTFDTVDEAWTWLQDETAKKRLHHITGLVLGRATVGTLIDIWLSKASLKQSTRIDYRIRSDKHIKAHAIGALPIGDVKAMDIDACLKATPMNWTRIHVAKILKTFFDWAENNDFIERDPYRRSDAKKICKDAYHFVRSNKTRESTDTTWTPEQFVTFVASETDPVYRAYWVFVAATGARRGEAIGLTWNNTHANEGWCLLADNITTAGNEIIHEDTPKTWATRKVHFGAVLSKTFLARKAEQDTYRERFPEWSTDWVFDRRRGKGARYFPGVHLAPATVTQRFNRQADELGLPHLAGPHGLRRTFATIAEAQGFKASVRTKAMGHTPGIEGRYTKTTTPELEALAVRLEELLIPSGSLD